MQRIALQSNHFKQTKTAECALRLSVKWRLKSSEGRWTFIDSFSGFISSDKSLVFNFGLVHLPKSPELIYVAYIFKMYMWNTLWEHAKKPVTDMWLVRSGSGGSSMFTSKWSCYWIAGTSLLLLLLLVLHQGEVGSLVKLKFCKSGGCILEKSCTAKPLMWLIVELLHLGMGTKHIGTIKKSVYRVYYCSRQGPTCCF